MASFAFAAVLAFCAIASYFDLRERRIPDKLNFFFLALAGALFLAGNDLYFQSFVYRFVPLVAAAFAFSYLLYRVGAWAGGDAKFFTALTAFLPFFNPEFSALSFTYIFLVSAAFLIPVMLAIFWKEALRLRKEFTVIVTASLQSSFWFSCSAVLFLLLLKWLSAGIQLQPITYIAGSLAILVVSRTLGKWMTRLGASAFLVLLALFGARAFQELLPMLALVFAATAAAASFHSAYGLLTEKILARRVKTENLREGMIPAETVIVRKGRAVVWSAGDALRKLRERKSVRNLWRNVLQGFRPAGRVIASPMARGLSSAEIRELKKAGVSSLVVKDSLPFAPVISAAFIAAALVGYYAF